MAVDLFTEIGKTPLLLLLTLTDMCLFSVYTHQKVNIIRTVFILCITTACALLIKKRQSHFNELILFLGAIWVRLNSIQMCFS